MYRHLAIAAGLAGLSLSAGCVNVMEQTAINQIAPEWFEAKTAEVKGEGYPKFSDIPQVRPFSGTLAEWRTQADAIKEAAEPLEAMHAEQRVIRTPEEIRAMAAQWRALAEGTAVPHAESGTSSQ